MDTRNQNPHAQRYKATSPLKSHPAWDQYWRLACENQLAPGLLKDIEAEAKGLLVQALTGLEDKR
jgi:hypothetical protein